MRNNYGLHDGRVLPSIQRKTAGGKRKKRRGGRKSRRKGGNIATAMGCKTGQVLASGSRCPLTSRFTPRYMVSGQCCINQGGGKRKKRRGGTRKKRRKFRKGTKSKTHRGKDFETRKTSKNYNSKRWKRMTGRRTRRAPLFPWA